ncbi:hypothetical protein EDF58_12514 [Novosphingobium sp. PhB57]|jgi:hypothetical protein|uniref:hypothetical protein n=1 Tax=Novosphingobium sp. PhB57 TaxID=2485107 RepID=UPI001053906F|nr:hypothetical protein [Novosphingobium sp. PhB57]TCU51424.1 hypothetical protein EDF58_12514 [Novosphingobium sp. PhB57]
MSQTIEQIFATREEADLAIEHLVQEHGIERTDIFVETEGETNSSGRAASGGDYATKLEAGRSDTKLGGGIRVSVDINDENRANDVRRALRIV